MAKQPTHTEGTILRQLSGYLLNKLNPNQLFIHYLTSSYGYYVMGESVWDDHDFDRLCQLLLAKFDQVTHPHKHLTDELALRSGTGFHISAEAYPPPVRHGWRSYVRRLNSGEIEYAIQRIDLIGTAAYKAELDLKYNQQQGTS